MKRKQKQFTRLETEDPESEEFYKGHDWDIVKKNKNFDHVIYMQCKMCNTEIECLGYFKNNAGVKRFVLNVEETKLNCSDILCRDLIE